MDAQIKEALTRAREVLRGLSFKDVAITSALEAIARTLDTERAPNGQAPAQPAPAAQDDAKDAARYRWLTDDHERPATRIVRNQLCERLPWMSYSAVSADIDAALEASKKEPT